MTPDESTSKQPVTPFSKPITIMSTGFTGVTGQIAAGICTPSTGMIIFL